MFLQLQVAYKAVFKPIFFGRARFAHVQDRTPAQVRHVLAEGRCDRRVSWGHARGMRDRSGRQRPCLPAPTPDAAPVCDETLISGSIGGTEFGAKREHVQPYMLAMAAEPQKSWRRKARLRQSGRKMPKYPNPARSAPARSSVACPSATPWRSPCSATRGWAPRLRGSAAPTPICASRNQATFPRSRLSSARATAPSPPIPMTRRR